MLYALAVLAGMSRVASAGPPVDAQSTRGSTGDMYVLSHPDKYACPLLHLTPSYNGLSMYSTRTRRL